MGSTDIFILCSNKKEDIDLAEAFKDMVEDGLGESRSDTHAYPLRCTMRLNIIPKICHKQVISVLLKVLGVFQLY